MTGTEVWGLFPYPTLAAGEGFTNGSIVGPHQDCVACTTRACLTALDSTNDDPQICRYGFTFCRVDSERLVVSLVSKDHANPTQKSRKRLRQNPDRVANLATIRGAIDAARELGPGVTADIERAKRDALAGLKHDPQFWNSIADDLRKDFEKNLNQSHDFLQLVKQVKGHAEVLLLTAHPDLDPESAAERMPTEGAIYFASTLMILKIDSLRYLNEVNLAVGNESRFRIHPFTLKYVRIYLWQANQRELDLQLVGQSYGQSSYNSDAVGAVLQSLLDNMIKYAPAGSKATIQFDESDSEICVSFTSLGPEIQDEEMSRIFVPGYRAVAARRIEEVGLGVGLATAKQICDVLGMSLSVIQSPDPDSEFVDRYPTTFSFTLARVDQT